MAGTTDVANLADKLNTPPAPGAVLSRITTITHIATTAGRKVRTEATDTAWVARAQDVTLAVGDRVWLVQVGGTAIVAGRLSGEPGGSFIKRKAANQVVTNSITLVDDLHLAVLLNPGAYRVEGFVNATNPDTADDTDIRLAWLNTGTMSISRSCWGPGNSSINTLGNNAAAGSGIMRTSTHASTTAVQYGITDLGTSTIREDLLVDVTVAGTLTLQWAQGVASANSTTVQDSSRLYVTPLRTF